MMDFLYGLAFGFPVGTAVFAVVFAARTWRRP